MFIEKGELTLKGLVSGLGERESKHLMRDAGTLCPEGKSRITSRVSPAACWERGEDTELGQARASGETQEEWLGERTAGLVPTLWRALKMKI